MSKVRTRRGASGPECAQLSCWIGQGTMTRLVAFVEARRTKQRVVVDAAILQYLNEAERVETTAADDSAVPAATPETPRGQ
jgi:hypothetical protein